MPESDRFDRFASSFIRVDKARRGGLPICVVGMVLGAHVFYTEALDPRDSNRVAEEARLTLAERLRKEFGG